MLEYHGNFAAQSVAFAYASATTYTYPVLHEQEYTHTSKSNDTEKCYFVLDLKNLISGRSYVVDLLNILI